MLLGFSTLTVVEHTMMLLGFSTLIVLEHATILLGFTTFSTDAPQCNTA